MEKDKTLANSPKQSNTEASENSGKKEGCEPDKQFTEVKNAHASGSGSLERNDQEQTGAVKDEPINLEGADQY